MTHSGDNVEHAYLQNTNLTRDKLLILIYKRLVQSCLSTNRKHSLKARPSNQCFSAQLFVHPACRVSIKSTAKKINFIRHQVSHTR